MNHPKYDYGEEVCFRVRFQEGIREITGTIVVVDAHGTFFQQEEPSYDIMVPEENNALFKHIQESWVIGRREI